MEKLDLLHYEVCYQFTAADDVDVEQICRLIEGAAISVIDDYMTDSPGYCGKVMIVVWPGGPELTAVYNYNKWGKLQRLELERIG